LLNAGHAHTSVDSLHASSSGSMIDDKIKGTDTTSDARGNDTDAAGTSAPAAAAASAPRTDQSWFVRNDSRHTCSSSTSRFVYSTIIDDCCGFMGAKDDEDAPSNKEASAEGDPATATDDDVREETTAEAKEESARGKDVAGTFNNDFENASNCRPKPIAASPKQPASTSSSGELGKEDSLSPSPLRVSAMERPCSNLFLNAFDLIVKQKRTRNGKV
jgi:hypothetical protein